MVKVFSFSPGILGTPVAPIPHDLTFTLASSLKGITVLGLGNLDDEEGAHVRSCDTLPVAGTVCVVGGEVGVDLFEPAQHVGLVC